MRKWTFQHAIVDTWRHLLVTEIRPLTETSQKTMDTNSRLFPKYKSGFIIMKNSSYLCENKSSISAKCSASTLFWVFWDLYGGVQFISDFKKLESWPTTAHSLASAILNLYSGAVYLDLRLKFSINSFLDSVVTIYSPELAPRLCAADFSK